MKKRFVCVYRVSEREGKLENLFHKYNHFIT